MATVQGIQEQQGSNWLLPTAAGTAIGAGLGAYAFPQNKYNTFDDLVKEATKGDSFEMPKAAENAEQTVKTNFETVSKELTATKDRLSKVGEMFKGETKEVELSKFLTDFGQTEAAADSAAFTKKFNLSKIVSGLAKDEEKEIPDAIKNLYKGADGNIDNNGLKAALKGFGDVVEGDGGVVTKFKPSELGINNAKAFASTANEAVVSVINEAGEGKKVVRESADKFAKAAQDAKLGEAFDAIKGQLGKARWKGAAIWGAVGLAAGFIASKLLGGGKKEVA